MRPLAKGMTSNKLKIIAIVAMFFDHFVSIFLSLDYPVGVGLKIAGRIVAPIMCFFIAEGYFHTSNRGRYITRLLIFAIVSHAPFVISLGYRFFQATSVIWPLALGLIALTAVKAEKLHILLKLFILGLCCVLAIPGNWNFVAVLWVVAFGIFHGNHARQIIAFCAVGIVFHLALVFYRFGFQGNQLLHQTGFFLAIPFLLAYNGKRGRKSKALTWAFYVFYPAHLILLYLLHRFTALSSFMGA
jgi:hypothetical protein